MMNADEVYTEIVKRNLRNIDYAKTPERTVGAELWRFVKDDDSRVKRIKKDKKYYYYLSEYENDLNLEKFIDDKNIEINNNEKENKNQNNIERSLHKIFVSYLKNENIYAKTIFHEKNNRSDSKQKWVNPDIIGVDFTNLKNNISRELLKSVNKNNLFNLYSYELKIEVNSDYDLKKYFFQAVSNSSWANFGYLVALDINDNLYDEMERLNKSFGIGIIKLNSNPFASKILFPAKRRNVDFQTIDKLISINSDFSNFIEKVNNILNIDNKNLNTIKKDFENNFCDKIFDINSDEEIKKYCKNNKIPFNEDYLEINFD